MTINIQTKAWAALGWVALAANTKEYMLGNVKLDYAPATGDSPARLTAHATDRFRVHRVVVDVPTSENDSSEPAWSVLVPAVTVKEAAKHPTVGKSRETLVPLTVTTEHIASGNGGWGATLPAITGNYPPVERLINEPTEDEQGPVVLDAKYLADLAKWNLGGRHSDTVWELTWTRTDNPAKPGPVLAHRKDDGISAVALIQPNIRIR